MKASFSVLPCFHFPLFDQVQRTTSLCSGEGEFIFITNSTQDFHTVNEGTIEVCTFENETSEGQECRKLVKGFTLSENIKVFLWLSCTRMPLQN